MVNIPAWALRFQRTSSRGQNILAYSTVTCSDDFYDLYRTLSRKILGTIEIYRLDILITLLTPGGPNSVERYSGVTMIWLGIVSRGPHQLWDVIRESKYFDSYPIVLYPCVLAFIGPYP